VTPAKKPEPSETEGWESLVEEASAGSLAPSPELEQAMREAAEAIEARTSASEPAQEVPKGTEVEERVAELERELEVLRDRHLRLAADFDNARRRTLREREEAHHFGHQNLVKELLPTVDNLERAIEHARQGGTEGLQGLLEGVELVARGLVATLTRFGLGVVSAEGEPFDPSRHEALGQLEDASAPEGTVLQVLQRGYTLRERLLRPARVLVAKRPAAPLAGGAPEEGPETRGGGGEA
jgi:molecular chaperone GrpE